jgi:predicted kinase
LKRLVLLVGIPGSGKTTLAQRLVDKGYQRFNADDIRQELFGDSGDQQDSERVFGLFFQRLEEAFARGEDVVVDNTNINTRHRSPILQRAISAGYSDIQIWILEVPLEVCLERNRARARNGERNVPEEIVTNYHNTLLGPGRPRRHEGKLVVVRPGEKDFEFKFFQLK